MTERGVWAVFGLALTCCVLHASVREARVDGAALDGPAARDAQRWSERIAIERALAEHEPAHQPRIENGVPMLGEAARFDGWGARLAIDGGDLAIGLVAMGRGGAMRELGAADAVVIAGPEVRLARGAGVVEWWRSLPSGLEQGVTLEQRPRGQGALRLEMTTGPGVSAELASRDEVLLRDGDGRAVARYAHVLVLDASGERVPAQLAVASGRIRIDVDDSRAEYPLVVDPLVTTEEATLLAPDGAASDSFGVSVACSSDGSRVLVGASGDDTAMGVDVGSARVLLRTGTTWAEEARLLAPDGSTNDSFGIAVALSSDGSRALVGARVDDTAGGVDAGSARVFVRSGTAWASEALLLAPDGAASDRLGHSVALSADGGRALVGVVFDDTAGGVDAGSARVFLRTGTTWVEEATLLATDGAAGDSFGWSVALSSDGSRALVGAYRDVSAGGLLTGSARVFVRTGTVWVEEATLLAADGAAGDYFGWSVALSSDGSRALVGAYRDGTAGGLRAGSAHAFSRAGTTWGLEAMLLAPDGSADDGFGWSVALSSDGSRALAGAYLDDTPRGANAGSTHVFLRAGTTWGQEAMLLAADGSADDAFGVSVAISSDGSRALVGAHTDDTAGGSNAGSARAFAVALAPNGSACGRAAVCASGFCTDGVCCDSACGGGASDCQACSAALTAGASGTCASLSPSVASGVICREAVASCDVAEACSSTSTACPTDLPASAATPCRAASAACDAAETCDGVSPVCPPDALAAAATACRPAAGACDLAESCTGTSALCPPDVLVGAGTSCRAAAATGCDTVEVCDGVSVACPGDAYAGAGSVCRSVMGPCDIQEVCSGGSAVCPADATVAAGISCRPPAGPCDQAEACSGSSPSCPPDVFASPTTVCDAAVRDVCDAPDHCTGFTANCPAEYLTGVQCRAPGGACDLAETCDGSSAACPRDELLAAGVACGTGMRGTCSSGGICSGASPACPGGLIRPAGTVCLPGMVGSVCDLDDVCDGINDACPESFAPETTACGAAASGACDAPDHCSGGSGDCIDEHLSGVECRAASDACDLAEVCIGDSAECPPDALVSAGISCRTSIDTSCDPEEMCDGIASACPADVRSCQDGGDADASLPSDASVVADAGPPEAIAGCGCRTTGRGAPLGLGGGVLAMIVVRARGSRRRRRPRSGARRGAEG